MSRDTHAPPESDTVPTAERQAWADEVRALIDKAAGGNTAKFARLVGTDRRTINRWKACEMAVTSESVVRVARACNIPAADLLVRIGLLERTDLRAARR